VFFATTSGLPVKFNFRSHPVKTSLVLVTEIIFTNDSKTKSMRKFLPAILLLLIATAANSQSKESPIKKLFIEGGTGPAGKNGAALTIGLKTVFKNNWTAAISYHTVEADPKNLPSDYERGTTIIILFPIPDEMPACEMKMFNITGGKLFETGRKTWITTEAGFSFGSSEKFSFASQQVTSDFLHTSSNYATQKKSASAVGGLLKADINWAFLRFAGLGLGFFANVNSVQTYAGGEIKLMIGMVNPRKK
jgi:hypothetical protein